MDLAQAILIFILLDRERLSRFLASSRLTEAELRLGTTTRLATQVLQHVLDDPELRDECMAAGVFMSEFDEAARGPNAGRASAAETVPFGISYTLH